MINRNPVETLEINLTSAENGMNGGTIAILTARGIVIGQKVIASHAGTWGMIIQRKITRVAHDGNQTIKRCV